MSTVSTAPFSSTGMTAWHEHFTLRGPATGGLGFDNSLSLFVANTDTNANPAQNRNHLVRFSADLAPTTQDHYTQASPRALAFAANNTLYVASPGSPATVRRYSYDSQSGQFSQAAVFTVPTDSSACVGIDLAPDQSTLDYVLGGRTVRTVAGANSASGSATATTLSPTLPNPGTACGIRPLPPVDARCALANPPAECLENTPASFPTPIVGGMIVADGGNIKRLDSARAVKETFNAGSGQTRKRTGSTSRWIRTGRTSGA